MIGGQVAAVQRATGSAVEAISSIRPTIAALHEVAHLIGESVRDQDEVRRQLSRGMHTVAASAQAITGSMNLIARVTEAVDRSTQGARAAS